MNKITLSFADLGFDAQALTLSRSDIINHACDTIMHYFFQSEAEEDCLFNVADAVVDMAAKTVTIETATFSLQ